MLPTSPSRASSYLATDSITEGRSSKRISAKGLTNAGRDTEGEEGESVFLNIYDMNLRPNKLLSTLGLGLHHSGIQAYDMEVTYGTTGVFSNRPRKAHGAVFKKSVYLGKTLLTVVQFKLKVKELVEEREFGPKNYDILIRNCNHFSKALAVDILQSKEVQTMPKFVNRLASMSSAFHCCFPSFILRGDTELNSRAISSSRPCEIPDVRNQTPPKEDGVTIAKDEVSVSEKTIGISSSYEGNRQRKDASSTVMTRNCINNV